MFVFFAIYSVIPKNFFFRKCFFEIGPFIKPKNFFFLINFKANLNDFSLYFKEIFEILLKGFENSKSILIQLILFKHNSVDLNLSLIIFIGTLYLRYLIWLINKSWDAITTNGFFNLYIL